MLVLLSRSFVFLSCVASQVARVLLSTLIWIICTLRTQTSRSMCNSVSTSINNNNLTINMQLCVYSVDVGVRRRERRGGVPTTTGGATSSCQHCTPRTYYVALTRCHDDDGARGDIPPAFCVVGSATALVTFICVAVVRLLLWCSFVCSFVLLIR
jgi:hypothetical protein